jgi:hypothetical protein
VRSHAAERRRDGFGRTVSQVGSLVAGVAFPLAAVLMLYASADAMGMVAPESVLSTAFGAWVDPSAGAGGAGGGCSA